MKPILALISFVVLICHQPAFSTNLDSLLQVWQDPNGNDTFRCVAMYDLILYGYLNTNPDTAFIMASSYRNFAEKKRIQRQVINAMMIQGYTFTVKGEVENALAYFEESLVLSEKHQFKSKEATSAILIGQMLISLGQFDKALTYLERSLRVNLEIDDKEGMIYSYDNLAIEFIRRNNYEKAKQYLQNALEIAVEMGDSIQAARTAVNLGDAMQGLRRVTEARGFYFRAINADTSARNAEIMIYALDQLAAISADEGRFEEALGYATKSRDHARNVGNKRGEASGWNLMGAVHSRQGLYVQAIEELNEALHLFESTNDLNGSAHTLGNIANIQLDQKAYVEALATYEKAKEIFERQGKNEALAQVNSSLGKVYRELNQPEKALSYYETSLTIAREISSPALTSYALARLADLYFLQGELEKARTYIKDALKLSDTPDDLLNHGDNLVIAGNIDQKAGNHIQAIVYAKKAYDFALEIGAIATLASSSEVLYQAYKATGQTAKALDMHEKHISYRDSMVNEENTRAMFQQQMRYEYEKKEVQTRAEQDIKDALAQQELSRRDLQRNASLGGFGLVAALAGVLFVNGRRRRKTNILLSAQKSEIELKSNQNELLLKEIHHRVKNNLQIISSLLHLQSAHIKDADVRQAVAAGQHRVESMALIHQKLYQRDNLAAIEMRDYLKNLVQSLIDTFDADPDRIQFELDMPELELDVDTAVPLGLIVNELITNSLKYAFPDGQSGVITVSLKKTGENLELLVADNGIGKGNTAKGTSFGSQLVTLLSTQLGGTITHDTTTGYETRLTI